MIDKYEAWSKVKDAMGDVEVETAYEIDELFVFSIRPAGAKPGFSTGTMVMTVDKTSGKFDSLQVGHPRLLSGNTFQMLEPSDF